MKNTTQFGMAISLGLAAAFFNWMWLSASKTPPTYVGFQFELKQGEEISDEVLRPVPIPGNVTRMRATLIPWSNRAILFGCPAPHDYAVGDLALQQDIQMNATPETWEVIGPFQQIGVGQRFRNGQDEGAGVSAGGNNVTIAVDQEFDEQTRRLLEVISNESSSTDNDAVRIVAVQVVPAARSSNPETASAETSKSALKNTVYQTVSLNGIPNVPRVLLEGDFIRFVVPAGRSLFEDAP